MNQASGDPFEDDLRNTIRVVESTGHGAAVVPACAPAARSSPIPTGATAAPDATLALVAPLWNVPVPVVARAPSGTATACTTATSASSIRAPC
ncbi:MAG: hypothetical protein IPH44_29545 [Myxococcales bacterium]|nr:hypothetical protein [Myxococcales bacterium]